LLKGAEMEVLELSYLTQLNCTLKNVKMATLRQREEGPRKKKKLLRPYLTSQMCWQLIILAIREAEVRGSQSGAIYRKKEQDPI
jgi:hypothetical protein